MVLARYNSNPFQGLRPFKTDESYLFFGREEQIDELLERLQSKHFLAVLGTSGIGKSSLVKAGLLHHLYSGFTVGRSSSWRVAELLPGNTPIKNLARALSEALLPNSESIQITPEIAELILERSSSGLVELLQFRKNTQKSNLLILIDQFEEIFRFKQQTLTEEAVNEAANFVNLLLKVADHPELETYIVITMRSDFIGDCSQFQDLPEMINESLYLVPRMTRTQLNDAIYSPVRAAEADMDAKLVNQLLSDVGDNPNQLPILQHALMRTWNCYWTDKNQNKELLTINHYESTGGIHKALSQHGDEIYNELFPHEKKVAEMLFKCLTLKEDGRYIRRPTKLKRICAVVKASEEDLIQIIEQFRREGRSFLTPYTGEINSKDVIDISHESLILVWQKLKDWSDEEAEKAEDYHRLVEAWKLKKNRKGDFLSDRRLDFALAWRDKYNPDQAWAAMYPDKSGETIDFNAVMCFLSDSEKKDNKEKVEKKRRQDIAFWSVFGFAGFVTLVCIIFIHLWQEAKKGQLNALSSSSEAYFTSNQTLQALIESVKAGKQLKQSFGVDKQTSLGVLTTLRKMIYDVRERNILKGHTGNIYSVSFSPDGTKIATAGDDKTIRLWSRNGQFIRFLTKNENSTIRGLSFSPDGKILVSVGDDQTIKLWKFDNHNHNNYVEIFGKHEFGITSVDFSPDGRMLVSGDAHGFIKIWNLNSKKLAHLINHNLTDTFSVNSIKFSPDGKTIVSASDDKTIKLWNVANGQLIKTLKKTDGHSDKVEDVSFSPDGKTIASASDDKTIKLWNVANGRLIKTLKEHQDRVNSVNFSPDGQTLASASYDKTIKLWNIPEGRIITTLEGHIDKVNTVRFSPDSKIIASASNDETIKLWSRDNQENMIILRTHLKNPNQIYFSPDGQILASASINNAIALWNVSQGNLITTLQGKDAHKGDVLDVKISPNGQLLATASEDKTIKIWNISKRNLVATLQGHKERVKSVSFSPNGQILASGSYDKTIKLWNLDKNTLITTFEGHDDGVNSVSFSSDGKLIASASNDNKIKLWSVQEKALLQTLNGHSDSVYSVSFSPDGKLLASASADKFIKLWSIPKRNFIQDFQQIRPETIWDISFSPDGQIIASANGDETIQFWNQEGELLNTFKEHRGTVWGVNFSHDGRLLASTSDDETIIIRGLDLDSLLISGCNKIRDFLENRENSGKDEERHLCDTLRN